MDNDFIKVSKNTAGQGFFIEIYFSKINSTVKVEFKESDFVKLILQSVQLYNKETSSFKLDFSETNLNELIAKKQQEELETIADKFRSLKSRPEIEAVIFISDEHVPLLYAEKITNACGDFMEAMGFEMETEDEPVFGSFFKKIKYFFSSTIGEKDLFQLYERGRKALELKYVELSIPEQTEKLANAAEKLVNSLENVEEGVIRCGGLIVLKMIIDNKSKLIIQQLSTEMIIILDKHPRLLFNVNTVYELLTGDVKGNIDNSSSETKMIA